MSLPDPTRARRICVSFSGGKTSAYMARWLQTRKPENEYLYVFANTGSEDEKTLEFVDRCAKEWKMDIRWVEAKVYYGERRASGFIETNFDGAARFGEPFERVIKKYGISNKAYPHCTRELKLNPIKSFIKHIGWEDCLMAVGIRIDEIDRMSPGAMNQGVVYPLIEWVPTTKAQVNEWWGNQEFTLDLPEHRGNCVWCWKKSFRKLLALMRESPEVFEFPERMEAKYGLSGHNVDGTKRVFFRQNTSVDGLRKMLTTEQDDLFLDAAGACSESCEVYADEPT